MSLKIFHQIFHQICKYLRPVTFKYNSDKSNSLQYGLIAEEVEQYYPNLVIYENTEDGQPESVKYDGIQILLFNELQRLIKHNTELDTHNVLLTQNCNLQECTIKQLYTQISTLMQRLSTIENILSSRKFRLCEP